MQPSINMHSLLTATSDGVLSDPSGDLVIKPCTQAEVAFYEVATASYPDLAQFMPRFLGTIHHNDSVADATSHLSNPAPGSTIASAPLLADLKLLNIPATHPPSSSLPGTAATLALNDVGPMKGKKIDTDLHIVLENIAASFKRPNILDLKLGARLWADDAKPAKQARLDKVSGETTSGSLGFRIAGMRVWQGKQKIVDGAKDATADECSNKLQELDEETNFLVYNKLYGRQFSAEDVVHGFKKYLHVPSAGIGKKQARLLTELFLAEVREMQVALKAHESRMYSSSILLVYEGDVAAFKEAHEFLKNPLSKKEDGDDDEEDYGDEDSVPNLYAVKLIDFAHASFTPGLGPDENVLQGVRNTIKILEQLLKEYEN
jgi:inositol-polyphosphate multikinase